LPAAADWDVRINWHISSHEQASAARAAAAEFVHVNPEHERARDLDLADRSADRLVFAATSERLRSTFGELLTNGLRHGDPPVRATLSRGENAWLLDVCDAATERPPRISPVSTGQTRGGLGLRLVTSLAASAGWYTDETGKHVWALIGDEAPAHLIAALRRPEE
jgi:two-component sensor histidine kinase